MKEEIDKIEGYYREYGPMILRRCRYILKDENLAYDVMHDIFVKLLSNPFKFKSSSSYLYRMATNHCINILKRNKKISTFWDLSELSGSSEIEDRIISTLMLDELFTKLPESTRVIAELKYLSKMTLDEVAEAVGMSQSGVRKRLKKLKEVSLKEFK